MRPCKQEREREEKKIEINREKMFQKKKKSKKRMRTITDSMHAKIRIVTPNKCTRTRNQ